MNSLVTNLLVFEIINSIGMTAHALGFHTLRWWGNIKATMQKQFKS
jgi:hypothetical protein